MSYPNDRFIFTEATIDDGREILEILEQDAFPGGISLIYTRRPNPYLSYLREGDETILAVCRDKKLGQIAGLGVCSIRELYVNGKVEKVGCLEGLRVRTKYKAQIKRIPQGYNYIFEQGRKRNVKMYITTILEENVIAQKFLEKRRDFMPDYIYLDDYEVLAFRSSRKAKLSEEFSFRAATKTDILSLGQFLNEYGCQNQFHPVISAEIFEGKYQNLSVENFYVLVANNQIVACGAIWNQQGFKQYIVKSYSGLYKFLQKISFITKLGGLLVLPPIGATVPISMLAFCGVKDFDAGHFKLFLQNVLAAVPKNELVTIGFPTSNPLLKTAKGTKHILYKSKIYIVDPDKTGKDFQHLLKKPMHIECATL